MAGKRSIVVLGSTGAQGGGVVQALLKEGSFLVKAVTRNPSSPSAQKLAAQGTTVLKADLADKPSLVQAFQGAYGVFVVTDIGSAKSHDMEIRHGTNAVDAAKEAGVQHLVFSTLEDSGEVMKKGNYKEPTPGLVVPHFQSKAAVAEYLRKSGVPFTLVHTSFFFENFVKLPYLKYLDGSYAFFSNNKSDVAVPAHSVDDIGGCAVAAFANPKNFLGKTVPVTPELIKLPEALDLISKTTGKTFKYRQFSDNQIWNLPLPGGMAKDLSNMFLYYSDFPEHVMKLRTSSTAAFRGPSFNAWVQANKDKLSNPPTIGVVGTLIMSAWLWMTGIIYG